MKIFRDKNILVTGGTGFVGSHLVEELVRQKANVVTTFITTNPRSYFFGQKLHKSVTMAHVDICDFNKVFDLVAKYSIDYIFHLAAQPIVDVAYYNPKQTYYTNILGTVNILESARLFPKIKSIIVASSDKAYGKTQATPGVNGNLKNTPGVKYKETDPLHGDHPYEASKSSADIISYSYFKTYNLPVVITRFGNIYGEGDLNFSRIIPGIIKSALANEALDIRSDGKYVRDYLYVGDVVSGYLLLAENIGKTKGQAYNFGSNETLSVLELIKLAEKILKKKIDYKILNIAKNEIPYQSLNFSKIARLGWKSKCSLKVTLKNILLWYKNNF